MRVIDFMSAVRKFVARHTHPELNHCFAIQIAPVLFSSSPHSPPTSRNVSPVGQSAVPQSHPPLKPKMQQRRSGPPSQSTPNSSGLAPRAPIQSYGTPRRATPTMASSWQSTSCSAWRRRTSSRSPPPRPCTAGRTAPWAPPHPWTTGLDPGSGRAVGIHDLVAWIHDPTA